MVLEKPIKTNKDLNRCFREFKHSLIYTKTYSILPLSKILYTGNSRRYAEYNFIVA